MPAAERVPEASAEPEGAIQVRRHLRFGWVALLAFLLLGVGLEVLQALRHPGYLSPAQGPRRLMWTLAHAHGTLLALVNLAFSASLPWLTEFRGRRRDLASIGLLAASVLMPAGFFLGGFGVHGGDPGWGIVFVPLGGALLAVAVAVTAWAARGSILGSGAVAGEGVRREGSR